MAITFVDYSAAAGSGTANPGEPTGAADGDLMIALIEGEGEDTNADLMTTSTGWTAIDGSTGSVASATDGAADRTRLTAYYGWREDIVSYQAADAGNHTLVVILCFRGVDPTTPLDQTPASTSDSTNDTSADFAGITTQTDGAAVVFCTSAGDNPNTPFPSSIGFSSWACADLVSISEIVDVGTNAGSDGSIGVAWGIDSSAGTVTAATATIGASEESASWTIAVRPAAPVAENIYTQLGMDLIMPEMSIPYSSY